MKSSTSAWNWPSENHRICKRDGFYEAIVWTKSDGTKWLRKHFPTLADAEVWVSKKRKLSPL